jgi:hypothetical protein
MAATNELQPRTGQITEFKNYRIPTRHSDICVCRNGVINRHAKGTEVEFEVVNEIAMTGVYLKLVRDGKKRVFENTDRNSTKSVPSHTSRIDCSPKSTTSFAHTLRGDAGRCPMQGSSIGRRDAQLLSTDT